MSSEGIHQSHLGGGVYNFLAASIPGCKCLSFYWSSGLLQALPEVGDNEGSLVAVYFISSLLAQIHTQGPVSPEERLGEKLKSKGIPSIEPARGKEVLNHLGVHLGSTSPSASFQHTRHTHIPAQVLPLLAEAQT